MPATDQSLDADSLRADHALIVEAAKAGGALARSYFGNDVERWDKRKGDPVTEADLAVDRLLFQQLTRARPGYGWLSEETIDNERRLDTDHVFIVDPIDGTRAFIKGKPHFAVSVALAYRGQTVAGVVYNPITEELFDAYDGGGARLNGEAIAVSARAELEGSRMLGHEDLIRHKAWKRPWPDMTLGKPNSIAYRLALVAAGLWDATLSLAGKSEWDLAAGTVLVKEAGGVTTDHVGTPFRFNGANTRFQSVIAGGPALHEAILDRVKHIALQDRH